MSRRSRSSSPALDSTSPRLAKRPRLDFAPLTPQDYKDGVMLAPMVRSGALPTRLFALKHGATLVWGPEIVDKAILHSERMVDPVTGTVSYNGKTKAIFQTHPVEKPYLIYQIGSADPELAVQAAKTVMQDVAGFDLNCGCPKPFSTHAGMGAALLTNPDLLCGILTALRTALPSEISLSCKIRLLPSQEDTLKLVERIANTGINALTVHCRTRNMRPREKARVERLEEIVQFVEGMGKGIAIIENGDCVGWEDAKRIRKMTGAHSAMIATAAEANPTCFSPEPLTDLEKSFYPSYIRVARHIGNHWSLTKFCTTQFKGAHVHGNKSEMKSIKEKIIKAKGFDDLSDLLTPGDDAEDFVQIVKSIDSRRDRRPVYQLEDPEWLILNEKRKEREASVRSQPQTQPDTISESDAQPSQELEILRTPLASSTSPNPALLLAPFGPANDMRIPLPACVSGKDADTPTPTPQPLSREVSALTL
ncbi:hypothetical protein QCA50_010142 [Cerrena zonata]|uniref:DUS-like FMN-binding domain-containing protein n=1 Tax=Cerrena zonata TaxID=2478898 RepID=A0AAW0G2D3_9APHY